MDPRDLELPKVLLRRDEVVATYQARTARWHALQAGAMAAVAAGAVAAFSGALPWALVVPLLIVSGAMLVVGLVALGRLDREFKREMLRLSEQVESLKGGRGP